MSFRTLVPSFSPDLLDRMIASMEATSPGSISTLVVGDNGLPADYRADLALRGVTFADVPHDPFKFSQAVNLMVAACDPTDDIFLFEDDMIMLTTGWKEKAEVLFASWPEGIGVLQCVQRASDAPSPLATGYLAPVVTTVGLGLSFIPRRVWDTVGPMDERFEVYGYEDTDWCVRALHEGLTFATTGDVHIDHIGGQVASMRRIGNYNLLVGHCTKNKALFFEKWGRAVDPEIKFEPVARHLERTCGCRGIA